MEHDRTHKNSKEEVERSRWSQCRPLLLFQHGSKGRQELLVYLGDEGACGLYEGKGCDAGPRRDPRISEGKYVPERHKNTPRGDVLYLTLKVDASAHERE